MKKRILSYILIFLLVLSTCAYAINISIDGNNVSFNYVTGSPFIDSNNRTQVPLRVTIESFGAKVGWNNDTRTAIVEKDGIKVEVPVGKAYIIKNGIQIKNDTAAIIRDNRTYLPIRAVLEAFGSNVGWNNTSQTVTVNSDDSFVGDLDIHFIEVGQADCILIELPTHEEILIDAGNGADSSIISNYLKSQNIDDIEYFILTHPHEDHIGSAADILNTFEVDKVYMPDVTATTQVFEDTLTAIKNNNVPLVKAKGGLDIIDTAELQYEILAPNSMFYSEVNEYSVVTKLVYNGVSFLFTGDAESVSELEMVRSGAKLDVDLLKVGHHGGETSTSQSFLNATTPKYAIISVGTGNEYGHPHIRTMDRLNAIGAEIYRTDKQGTIIASSDGQNIRINKTSLPVIQEQAPVLVNPTPAPVPTQPVNQNTLTYIGNKNTLKFHYPTCSSVDAMNPSNKVSLSSRAEAIRLNYVPCGRCNP